MKLMEVRKTLNLQPELAESLTRLAVKLQTTEQRLIRGILSKVLVEVSSND
ncbi:hypothetical protein [Pseudoalteromonas xiamenensis]|uniref:Uncharacterized protein n=1 Tax=Pseudoalteromonas xiamenensis TaxID=882626 RepID=A0A975HK58_9GAMM|nr:hypothetical protein [Pseudoalteromonas xiamenensis]QTH70587.1 hypothetical protein J5O05_11575 [Pseudoalteromonas xiamenensis]